MLDGNLSVGDHLRGYLREIQANYITEKDLLIIYVLEKRACGRGSTYVLISAKSVAETCSVSRFRVIPWLPGRCERPVQVHYTHSGWSGDEK